MPHRAGGVTVLAINPTTTAQDLTVPMAGESYTLTTEKLESSSVQLNGKALEADSAGDLPPIAGIPFRAGSLRLARTSITFVTIPEAGNSSCQ
jgi:heparanase